MKRFFRRSQSEQRTSILNSHLLRLLGCACLLALGSGCDGWPTYPPRSGEGDTSGTSSTGTEPYYPEASGVNIFNCFVSVNDTVKKGYAYSVFWTHDNEPWPVAPQKELYPIFIADPSIQHDCPTLDVGSDMWIPFDQPGVWKVMLIEMNYGDAYSGANLCNSSSPGHDSCASNQWEEHAYTASGSAQPGTITKGQ